MQSYSKAKPLPQQAKMTENFPYLLLDRTVMCAQINNLAEARIPFLFIIDYKTATGFVIRENELDRRFVRFEIEEQRIKSKEQRIINGISEIENTEAQNTEQQTTQWQVTPVAPELYKSKFEYVQEQIHKGNSFLVNLTQPSEVQTNLSLLDIYEKSSAKYKLWIKDRFTVLSPETFVQIKNGEISSFPMKGTIDASIPHAEALILNDIKEKAEHATIVDLIRNDLSTVANQVEVKRYRYIDVLHTNKGDLLQVSSEIGGKLPEDYGKSLGDILFSLLPAGSICGAPKPKTLQIIEESEGYDRGFYTGICGFFDGKDLDSAVMIRFVEQQDEKLVFKSGGGITSQSNPEKEYEELVRKVYVPLG